MGGFTYQFQNGIPLVLTHSQAGSVCTFEHILKYSADEDIEACLEFATDHRPPILFKLLESVPVCRLLFLKDGPRMARRIIRKVGSLWPKVLEKLLWSPKDLVACLAAAPNLSRFEAENMRPWWSNNGVTPKWNPGKWKQ